MRLKDSRESTNLEDRTSQSPFEGMLQYLLTPNLYGGAPGGYARQKLVEVHAGNLSHLPAEAYPYSDEFSKKLIEYQKRMDTGYRPK